MQSIVVTAWFRFCLRFFLATFFLLCCAGARAEYGGLVHDDMTSSAADREILTSEQARDYMLTLINRDRTGLGLKPVALDEAANKAAQLHSDDMAAKGYLSHWNFDGKDPFQRYTEAGGKDWDMENVYFDSEGDSDRGGAAVEVPLVTGPIFRRPEIDKMESSFFGEKPPYDGHRRNIIDPNHTHVGIGISAAMKLGFGIRMACDQEFINKYGEFGDIPKEVTSGARFTVQGRLDKGFNVFNVDVLRSDLPTSMDAAALSKPRAYGPPHERVITYFPSPLPSPAPLVLKETDKGTEFSVDVSTADWKPGLYYMTIWIATSDKPKDPFLASGRTVAVTASGSEK
jgi:hypothetical protein